MSSEEIRPDTLEAGEYLVHEDYGLTRFVNLDTRTFGDVEHELVVLQLEDGKISLRVDQTGKLRRLRDGEAGPSRLGRMDGRKSKGRTAPHDFRDPQLAAAEWLRYWGVYELGSLVERVGYDGIKVSPTDLDELEEEREDVVRVDDLYVSTVMSSRAAQAVRALHQIGVDDREEITAGVRRMLQYGSTTPAIGKAVAAREFVGATVDLWEDWEGPVDDEEIGEHLQLVQWLQSKPGGVSKVGELREFAGRELGSFAASNPDGNSPLLERVSVGVVGVRGAEIDVAAIESIRKTNARGWSSFGRLDRDRLWVEAKSRRDQLGVRLTNDVSETLGHEPFALVSATGARLGTLVFSTSRGAGTVSIEWMHDGLDDWLPGEHVAILEIQVRPDRTARLFSGSATTRSDSPRFIDGCVLLGGAWGCVVEVDRAVTEGSGVGLPLGMGGTGELQVGEMTTVPVEEPSVGQVTIVREPHSFRLDGLEVARPDLPVGGFARIRLQGGLCRIEVAPPTDDPTERLLRSLGIFETPQLLWGTIGRHLGCGNEVTDRRSVKMALADRLRFDLVALASVASNRARPDSNLVVPDQLEVSDGFLRHEQAGVRLHTDGGTGNGLFGFRWVRNAGELSHPDTDWAKKTLTCIRAWSAAPQDGQIVIERHDGLWITSEVVEGKGELNEILETLAEAARPFSPPELGRCFPENHLDYLIALSEANRRVERLEISQAGWWSTGGSGRRAGPTPIEALTLG